MKTLKILIALLFVVTQSQASYLTLGTDTECDFNSDTTSIQNLIDTDYDDIRITNQTTYVENLYIPKSKVLTGGYANCDDAHNDIVTSESIIDGNDTYSVITLASDNGVNNISSLKNLKLTNGNGADYAHGGGITVVEDASFGLTLTLNNVDISGNRAFFGGGILVQGNIDIFVFNSLIINNTASINGGGIHCTNGSINLLENTGVSFNKAESGNALDGNGGGIYSDDCNITLKTASQDTLFDFRGLSHNQASGHGGGIFLEKSAGLYTGYRLTPYPVNINNNIADSDNNNMGQGGGIYASDSYVSLQGTKVSNNSAESGAALAIVDDSSITSGLGYLSYCWNRSKCNEFSDNFTTSNGGKGGVMYIHNSEATFAFSHFKNNHADLGVIFNAEFNSSVSMTQSKIYKNGEIENTTWDDNYLYRFINSELEMLNITSADNQSSSAIFRFFNSTYNIYNSIFHSPNTAVLAHNFGPIGVFKCALTTNTSGIQSTNNVVIDDPLFIDRTNDNYHLSAESPAIDLCENEEENVNQYVYDMDMDGELVGWDDPTKTNVLGTVDVGSDETYLGDVIFSSSF